LQALLATDPENALIPKTVRWLMWTRSGGYWHTTQETASIVAALAQYLAATGTPEAPSSYSVFVNSQLVAEDLVTRENVAEHRVLRVSNLAPGDNEIRVVNEGAGDLHLATTLQYVAEQDTVQAARSLQGPLVQRQYEDPQTGKLLTSVRVGDLVRVRLTVEAPQDMWYVIVEDAFPAGTEAVDDTLSATGMTDGERQLHWSHADLRGEKAVFFTAHLSKGVYQYVYLIRATMAGRFRALPAEAKPMYEPEVWGRSTSSLLTVDEVR
jgi:uncharacterized protein YfaS (alpha-2-macroglobulin family)